MLPAQARFEPDEGLKNIKAIIAKLPETFTAAHSSDWTRFFNDYPSTVTDIPAEREVAVSLDALPRCSTRVRLSSLARHQAREHILSSCICHYPHMCA